MYKEFKKVNFKDLSLKEKIIVSLVAAIIIIMLLSVESWALMVFIGSLHSFIDAVPALSFWAVFYIYLAISIIYKAITNSYRLI